MRLDEDALPARCRLQPGGGRPSCLAHRADVEHNQVIRLMANGGAEAATPAALALVEPAERFESDTDESCPDTLRPSGPKTFLRRDCRRHHRLSYLRMRT